MSKTEARDLALKAWQVASLLICIALFIALMVDIAYKYALEMTTVGIRLSGVDKQEKNLPCLTFCPWMAFKERGFHFKSLDFKRSTFTKEEVFTNLSSWYSKPDSNDFLIEDVGDISMGRCYMVCPLKGFTMGSHQRIYTSPTMDFKGTTLKQQ